MTAVLPASARRKAPADRRPPRIALLAVLALMGGPGPATAQVTQAWLRYTPIGAFTDQYSTRLSAMGGIQVSVPDDASLIDAYHYGSNPGALLGARDTSIVEVPLAYQGFDDQYYGQSNSAFGRGAGFRSEFRPSRKWGMAAEVYYGSSDASRHDGCPSPDDCRFIRDFDLPVAPESDPVPTDRTFGAGVRSPSFNVTYARTFFPRVTLGGRLGYRKETEDRHLLNPYDLDVESSATQFQGGAEYVVPIWSNSVRVSGWAEYVDGKVVGVSESPLNADRYTWERPSVGFGGAVFVKRSDWLTGIIDGRHYSYDGEEIAQINWAPQYFMNPFPADNDRNNVFRREWSAFLSGFRHNEGSTRWMVGWPGRPVHLGLRYAYFREYQWIRPNESVIETVDPLDVKRLGYRFASGLSLDLPDQEGVVAVETRISHETRTDFTGELPEISLITYTYHLGAEYRVRPDLPVRAGVQLVRHDPNREDGLPPVKGIGATVGLGYFWKTLGSQIDFAYAYTHFGYAPNDPSQEMGTGNGVSLYLRRLF